MKNNKELTPMMELIEIINDKIISLKSTSEYDNGKDSAFIEVLDIINELLPKEKQVIEDAHKEGQIFEGREQEIWKQCETYYNTKYNNQIK